MAELKLLFQLTFDAIKCTEIVAGIILELYSTSLSTLLKTHTFKVLHTTERLGLSSRLLTSASQDVTTFFSHNSSHVRLHYFIKNNLFSNILHRFKFSVRRKLKSCAAPATVSSGVHLWWVDKIWENLNLQLPTRSGLINESDYAVCYAGSEILVTFSSISATHHARPNDSTHTHTHTEFSFVCVFTVT